MLMLQIDGLILTARIPQNLKCSQNTKRKVFTLKLQIINTETVTSLIIL